MHFATGLGSCVTLRYGCCKLEPTHTRTTWNRDDLFTPLQQWPLREEHALLTEKCFSKLKKVRQSLQCWRLKTHSLKAVSCPKKKKKAVGVTSCERVGAEETCKAFTEWARLSARSISDGKEKTEKRMSERSPSRRFYRLILKINNMADVRTDESRNPQVFCSPFLKCFCSRFLPS